MMKAMNHPLYFKHKILGLEFLVGQTNILIMAYWLAVVDSYDIVRFVNLQPHISVTAYLGV